jgi:hypothetical protein
MIGRATLRQLYKLWNDLAKGWDGRVATLRAKLAKKYGSASDNVSVMKG